MEQFKIEYFRKTHLGIEFPSFATLNTSEANAIRRNLLIKLRLDQNLSGEALLDFVTQQSKPYNANALDESFCLNDIVKKLGVIPNAKVFINWGRWEY